MLPASTSALVLNSATIVINGVTIALGLVILVLILWQDSRSEANVFYAIFMLMAMAWSAGTLLTRVSAYIGGPTPLTELGIRLLGIGFTGSSIGLYLFTVIVSGGQRWRFMRLAVLTAGLVIVYQVVLMSFSLPPTFENRPDGTLAYSFGAFSTVLYISFTAVTLLVAGQRRRKVRVRLLLPGIYGFSIGMLIELISPELRRRAIGMDISAISALLISYAMVRAQIIDPLSGRANQLQAVRDVGLAITSRLRLEDVLSSIGRCGDFQGDGAAIFLIRVNRSSWLPCITCPPPSGAFGWPRTKVWPGQSPRRASRCALRIIVGIGKVRRILPSPSSPLVRWWRRRSSSPTK
jgi:hypothetical protein